MNNILILVIAIIVLIILFLIIILTISKNKIKEIIIPLDVSKEQVIILLKEKFKSYKDITTFIKDNVSVREDAFKTFDDFNPKVCTQKEIIGILDKTTVEINDYIIKYNELLKKEDFLLLKRDLYNTQLNLEALIDYYNSKINIYNNLKTKGPTSIASRFFTFDEYEIIANEKNEIATLINLN